LLTSTRHKHFHCESEDTVSFLNLDLNLLRVFDAVMTEQNLTRAADRLATTQPAVSNALRRLRETIDDELFTRTPHGVKPTPRAEGLRSAVRLALSTLEAAITNEKSAVSETEAMFRMSMADSTASLLLPSLIRQMKLDAPKLSVRTLPPASRDPRPSLLQNDIDLAVGSFPGIVAQLAAEQGTESPIRHSRMYRGEYVCIMRNDHPLANSELTLDSYCAADHVLLSFSGRPQGQADMVLEGLGRKRRIVLTVNQFYTVGQIVEGSDLISIMPRHLIASTRMEQALVSKKLPFSLPSVRIDMLWHERDAANPRHVWLRNTLHAIADADMRLSSE
jgi:DNA-binding transcriptional LysR family regulator